jgi:5-methylcytosine-specific restriction enzyme B
VSPQHMKQFLFKLGIDEQDIRKASPLRLNRLLLTKLREYPETQDLSTHELMEFLYDWNDPREKDNTMLHTEKKLAQENDKDEPPSTLFLEVADALERKGQVILHGPPGTGKTYHALRFAEWWLARSNGRTLDDLTARQTPRRVWWVVANPKQWHWDDLFTDGSVEYKYGRLKRNYPLVQPGDLVVGYLAAPEKRIYALARVTEGLHDKEGDPRITLEPVHRIENGLTYAELTEDSTLNQSEPIYNRCQGTLFKLEEREADYLLSLLAERDPKIEEHIDQSETQADTQNQLTLVTFHPSYSYEDFIEGFRPQDTGEGLRLRLADGLFKTVCATARANPERKYLVFVDEINRANLAKVFGEIITLLERDKRGVPVVLPQSKEPFSVPNNVYMLGTMNTSDRSIRLMDAALRRRFGFIEVMPDLSLLRGAQIDGVLDLYDFLMVLNTRVSRTQGREKQIGHSFFLEDGQPVSDGSEFARRFRQEVLPLLQEYCYDDYGELAEYIGTDLVDVEHAVLLTDVLHDDEKLVSALAEFASSPTGSE